MDEFDDKIEEAEDTLPAGLLGEEEDDELLEGIEEDGEPEEDEEKEADAE